MPLAHVLISDVTGSTHLYETESNQLAMQSVTGIVERMGLIVGEYDGTFVKSQGDDALSYFSDADRAFHAAWSMITEKHPLGLSVHAGLSCGEVVSQKNDIFGDAVNTAARLSAAAKPQEILISGEAYDGLSSINRNQFVRIGNLQFKGKQDAVRVYSCIAATIGNRTEVSRLKRATKSVRTESAEFSFGDRDWHLSGGRSLTIGRSLGADIVVPHPWVSRDHATLSIKQAQLEFVDHSSAGSLVQSDDGNEVFVHRRSNLLTGSGVIFLASSTETGAQSAIRFSTLEIG